MVNDSTATANDLDPLEILRRNLQTVNDNSAHNLLWALVSGSYAFERYRQGKHIRAALNALTMALSLYRLHRNRYKLSFTIDMEEVVERIHLRSV